MRSKVKIHMIHVIFLDNLTKAEGWDKNNVNYYYYYHRYYNYYIDVLSGTRGECDSHIQKKK